MSALLDLWPVVFFFAAYTVGGIYVATGVLIVGVLLQVLVTWIRHRTASKVLLATAAVTLVLGGLTIAFHDPTFIKWKPTVLYWTMAVVLSVSHFTPGPTLVERLAGKKIRVEPTALWTRVNGSWAAIFALIGVLNLFVAYNFSESFWVKFKLFGVTGLLMVLMMATMLWLERKADKFDVDDPKATKGAS